MDPTQSIRVAAVQAAPAFLDKAETTKIVCRLILDAGSKGAQVVGFPEGFVPGYPGWVELLPLTSEPSRSLFRKLFTQALEIPGPETDAISDACKEAGIYAVIGVSERRPNTTGTLWNTNLFFGKDGSLMQKHQKFVPTVGERLIHAAGTTGSKAGVATEFGPISSLICGENGNPLAQYSISLNYPVVHVASWPPHWAIGQDVSPMANLLTSGLASSVGCYVINSIAVIGDDVIEAYGTTEEVKAFLKAQQKRRQASIIAPGGRVIVSGKDENPSEEIICADVTAEALIDIKYGLDYAGHYNRPEIFAHHFEQFLKN